MAQTLTLEEAAATLGLPVAEFKRRIQMEWKHVRSFRDGGTLRFQANVIEELGRGMGLSSDSELQLDANVGSSTEHLTFPSSQDSLLLPESEAEVGFGTQMQIDLPSTYKAVPPRPDSMFQTSPTLDLPAMSIDSGTIKGKASSPPPGAVNPPSTPGKPLSSAELILAIDSSDSFDVLPMDAEAPKRPSAPVFNSRSATDSDIRLEGDTSKKPAAKKPFDDEDALLTDEINLDMPQFNSGVLKANEGPRSGRNQPKPPPAGLSSSSIKKPKANEDSNFELSLDADSSAEFEISIADDLPPVKSRGDQAARSGVNLGKPADSGLNLDRKNKSKFNTTPESDDSIDFEISLDAPGMGGGGGMSGKNLGSRSSRNIMDSDSEFEISLDDLSADEDIRTDTSSVSQGARKNLLSEDQDIFETDFNLLADESGSEVQDLVGTDSESSEFDLELDGDVSADESASVAVELDDDEIVSDADGGISFDDMEMEEGSSASGALRGVDLDSEADEYDNRPVRTEPVYIEKKSAPWGPVPAILLIPTFFIIFVGGLMGFEMIRGMSGYEQSGRPSAVLLDNVSSALGVKGEK